MEYLQPFLNTREITKFEKLFKFGKDLFMETFTEIWLDIGKKSIVDIG